MITDVTQYVKEYVIVDSEHVIDTGMVTIHMNEPVGRIEYNRAAQFSCSFSTQPVVLAAQTPEVCHNVILDNDGGFKRFEPIYNPGGSGIAFRLSLGKDSLMLFDFIKHNHNIETQYEVIVPRMIAGLKLAEEHIETQQPDWIYKTEKEF